MAPPRGFTLHHSVATPRVVFYVVVTGLQTTFFMKCMTRFCMYVHLLFTCIICATIICLIAATHNFNLFASIIYSKRVSIMSTEIH